jgi:hypothetical protein
MDNEGTCATGAGVGAAHRALPRVRSRACENKKVGVVTSEQREEIKALIATVFTEPGELEGEKLLTALEAAKILNVNPKWLYWMAARLPFTRRLSARTIRFSEAGLRAWLHERRG